MSQENIQTSQLVFFVNGKKVVEDNPDPEWMLIFYLRKKLELCGTKLGCADGGCGACTVMLSKYDYDEKKATHLAINACLTPVCAVHGMAITTVEGIGSTQTRLHPVQERIAKSHGSQCGFCTPGIVMSMYALLRSMPKPSYSDLEVAFQGNLCRCTGYRSIIDGYKTFTEDWEVMRLTKSTTMCSMGEKCCKVTRCSEKSHDKPILTFDTSKFTPYDPSQEPIFPPELALSPQYNSQKLIFKGPNVTWYRPTKLEDLLKLKSEFGDAKIIKGNTEVGIEVKFRNCIYPNIIMSSHIGELNDISLINDGVMIGSSVTLTEIEIALKSLIKSLPSYKTRIFQSIVQMLNQFGGKQIRNVASVGGNIMTGSPISDLNPIFMASQTKLNLKSVHGIRQILMDRDFFTGYRKNIVLPEEVLISIEVPFTSEKQFFKAFKQSRRRDEDITIVNMALNVEFEDNIDKIKNLLITFGGMAPVTALTTETCKQMIGSHWNNDLLIKIYHGLLDELHLDPSALGGMPYYRQLLTLSIFFKTYLEISNEIIALFPERPAVSSRDQSGIGKLERLPQKSSQYFSVPTDGFTDTDLVGHPVPHVSAEKHATGEAVFCDDMPLLKNELFMAIVQSTAAHAKIVSIDSSAALSMKGVVTFFSAADIDAEKNRIGFIARDEEIFASKMVFCQGQIIGIIIAQDQLTAQRAAKEVKVVYELIRPIISTKDAMYKKSFFPGYPKIITKGNVDGAFREADYIVENEFCMGGQEHFYLETQTARAVPKKEDNEIDIFCSLQHPSEISRIISNVLDIPVNRINMKVKRVGGGFGGKESRSMLVAVPVAFAAHKLQKPVRCMLDRDEDMMLTGNRHPFYFKYKIGVKSNGKILGAKFELYCNGGCTLDLSPAVIERAMLHCENAYNIPNIVVEGYVCKTNLPSNTVFRGSGSPQAMMLAENYIREIAQNLNLDHIDVAKINFYNENDVTFYDQRLTNCTLKRCWEECLEKSNYHERLIKINEYNLENRFTKKGISIVPTKFGVAFTVKHLNQAGALIHVYTDGSVLLTHGGIEMGQGLHTKMIQIATRTLNIDASKIYISETATDKIPNTSPTAASISSDLNGMAVLDACNIIMDRLKPFIDNHPDGKWEDWVLDAYTSCVSLSAVGYYYYPHTGYDINTNTGTPYNYFTYGAGCSEVEIDCLTGEHQVIRTDIVMDVGESLNPAIDIGQIEGAFVQGYGLFTLEEIVVSPNGILFSRGPSTYKIPAFTDIPKEFNVSLLRGAPNPRTIYSSKAIGEPPLFIAASVFFAIKQAVTEYRHESIEDPDFPFYSPATAERIRIACQDPITSLFEESNYCNSYWNVDL